MDDHTTDLIQGTLDMLILKALSLEPMHGFGIARRIEQTSRGVFRINPGSLLTAFQRLERAGLIERRRTAQLRPSRLRAVALKDAAEWFDTYRAFWEAGFDRMDQRLRADD